MTDGGNRLSSIEERPDKFDCFGMQPQFVAMTSQETMPDMLPPMLGELYAAVSPDGPEHWTVVKDKLWRLYRTEPNMALSELAHISAPTLLIVADHDIPTVPNPQRP